MVIMTHQTLSLEKYWKLLPATLKGYIFPHVETEELYLGKIHFYFLLADRSIPIDYFKLLLQRTIVLCV